MVLESDLETHMKRFMEFEEITLDNKINSKLQLPLEKIQ